MTTKKDEEEEDVYLSFGLGFVRTPHDSTDGSLIPSCWCDEWRFGTVIFSYDDLKEQRHDKIIPWFVSLIGLECFITVITG